MNPLPKIFSLNTLILLGSLAFLLAAIHQWTEIYHPNKLTLHTGIVERKWIDSERREKIYEPILYLKLSGDTHAYKASRYISLIDRSLSIGDSIQLCTKKITSAFGNTISDEDGRRTWTTVNPDEIFQLISTRDNRPLIDAEVTRQDQVAMFWMYPLASLLFLGWFLYRRSGQKSMFVIES
jgi:hypothetical protein